MQSYIQRKSHQRGITMVEILFTVFLMSIGLLGLSALQLKTLNNVSTSHTKTEVNYYLQDMAERIRANQSGNYDGIDKNTTDDGSLVSKDAVAWKELLAQGEETGGLPAGAEGTVSLNANIYTIAISWTEQLKDGSDDGAKNQSFSMTVRI